MIKKKIFMSIFMIFTTCILFSNGCSTKSTQGNDQKGNEETNMQETKKPITDFKELEKKALPETKEQQSATDVVKIYFYEVEDLRRSDKIAIDLQNKVAQLNPRTGHFYGDVDFDRTLSDEEVETVLNILREGHAVEWERKYLHGDEDMLSQMGGEGYNWYLFLQYKDGTMSIKSGKGVSKNEILPEGYAAFSKGLSEFMDAKGFSLTE